MNDTAKGMYGVQACLPLVMLLVLLSGACARSGVQPSPPTDPLLAAARDLIADRRPRDAAELIESVASASDLTAQLQILLGDARLRAGDYHLAADRFRTALERQEGSGRVWYQYWLSRLLADAGRRETRADIATQIEQLAGSQGADAAFGVYLGYRLLRRDKERLDALERLLEMPIDGEAELLEAISGATLEEVLIARDRRLRHRLAEAYLDRFSPRRGEDLAARAWVDTLEDFIPDQASVPPCQACPGRAGRPFRRAGRGGGAARPGAPDRVG